MFRVLLAQKNERNNKIIKRALADRAIDIDFIEVAPVADDVVKNVEIIKPDVLIISYDMGEDTGIGIVERLKEIKLFGEGRDGEKKTRIIITSKRDEYQLIRKAFRLGVTDFLVEPLEAREILDSMEGIMEGILEERIKNIHSNSQERKISDYNNLSEYAFFYNVMFDEEYRSMYDAKESGIESGEKGFIAIFDIKAISEGDTADYYNLQKKLRQKLNNRMRVKLGPILNDRMGVYIQCDDEYAKDDVKMRNLLYWSTKEICDLIQGEMKAEVKAGVGRVYPIERIGLSYEESLRALIKKTVEKVVVYKEKSLPREVELNEYKDKVQRLIESIEIGNGDSLDCFVDILELLSGMDEEEQYNRILLVLSLATCSVIKNGSSEVESRYYVEEFRKNLELRPDDIGEEVIKRFNSIIKNGKSAKVKKLSSSVKFCVDYIYSNYRNEIVLKDISGMCGVSVQYLSKVFREETGKNFVDYLNGFRIKKAKELMINKKGSIKEICFEVGYNDPNYFSRIFKKMTGKTPRQFEQEYVSY